MSILHTHSNSPELARKGFRRLVNPGEVDSRLLNLSVLWPGCPQSHKEPGVIEMRGERLLKSHLSDQQNTAHMTHTGVGGGNVDQFIIIPPFRYVWVTEGTSAIHHGTLTTQGLTCVDAQTHAHK